jgi:hypothetical protein
MLIVSLESVLVEYYPFADKALNMFPASVEHIREMVSAHVFGCISIIFLQGVI